MRRGLLTFALCTLFIAGAADAPNLAQKFRFLPLTSERVWGQYFEDKPIGNNEWSPDSTSCKEMYENYVLNLQNHPNGGGTVVYNLSQCILEAASEMQKQTLQAASILLGIVPILLSTAGLTLTELALISVQRPVLAFLFSVATAAVFPSRLLSFYDDLPREVFERRERERLRSKPRLGARRPLWPTPNQTSKATLVAIGILEYTIALIVTFNTLYTSWQLGLGTISVLRGSDSYYPLLWVCLPVFVHAIVCGAFHYHLHTINRREQTQRDAEKHDTGEKEKNSGRREGNIDEQLGGTEEQQGNVEKQQDNVTTIDSRPPDAGEAANLVAASTPLPRSVFESAQDSVQIPDAVRSEPEALNQDTNPFSRWELHLLPAPAHPPIPAALLDEPSFAVEIIHRVSTILGYAQVVVGIIFFSSLLFITTADAAMIVLRYLLSAIVCRTLIALEIRSMRVRSSEEAVEQAPP